MTIASTVSRMQYLGAGSTGPYPFVFRIFAAADLLVTKRSTAGLETTLSYLTDFVLAAGTVVGDGAGGAITLTVALAASEVLTIRRVPALLQPTSLTNQGNYFGKTHEDAFDRLVAQVQALDDRVRRSIGVRETYDPATLSLLLPAGETGKVLGWDSGSTLTNKTLDSSAVALPGNGRTDPTLSAYLANNAVFNLLSYAPVGVPINTGINPTQTAAAFAAWTAAINAAGGGIGVIPPGTYAPTLVKATAAESPTAVALCAFANLTSFTLVCAGATIADGTAYGAEEAIFASFSACSSLTLGALKATSATYTPYSAPKRGLILYLFKQGCAGVVADVDITGGQKGIFINRDVADPLTYTSTDFRVAIKATNTQYPLLCRFSGDNVVAAINATGCGRNYYAIGCANHSVRVKSKNQTGSTIIGAFSGLGCANIELWYADTGSDLNVATSEAILLQWSDQSAAMHKNIKVHLDINNPSPSPFSSSFAINKVNNLGNPDIVGRGHVLDGLTIDGKSLQINGVDHLRCYGAFVASNDTVRNVSLRGLTLLSGGVSNVHLGNLLAAQQDTTLFEQVYTDGGLYSAEAFTVSGATNATPIVVTTDAPHDLFDGMQITIAGVVGNTNANGTYYAKKLSTTTVGLYTDAGLTTGRAGSGAYVSGGSGSVVATSALRTVYLGCTAKEVTAGITDQGVADYLDTTITTGAKQSNATKRYDGRTSLNTVYQPTTLPRMTAAQRTAYSVQVAGHQVFNTDTGRVDVYGGGGWEPVATYGSVTAIYGAAIPIDAPYSGTTTATITATNGVAFTVGAPTSAAIDKLLTVTIRNASGGALGVATWNAIYKMAAWTQPATGFSRSITFRYDGSNWIEVSRTPADVPN